MKQNLVARIAGTGWSLFLVGVLTAHGAEAAAIAPTNKSALDFAPPPVDAAFTRALAKVKQISGLQETNPGVVLPAWTTGLCMLIGFRTDHGSKQFIHLVEVTTLKPAEFDARGRSIPLPIEKQSLTFNWTNQFQMKPRTRTFSTPKYPVRVRLFDAEGRFLTESREHLPWGFLTNGLVAICALVQNAGNLDTFLTNRPPAAVGTPPIPKDAMEHLDRMETGIARGGLALGGLFGVIGDTDALREVRAHATAVVRPPNLLKALFEMKLDLQLDPKFEQATNLPPKGESSSSRRVLFPLALRQGQRILTHVDFIAGSTEGAYFLSSGVRALRATHPTKSDRSMLAQVLAVGTVSEPSDGR